MNKFLVVVLLLLSLVGCSRVEPNYVGVMMQDYGKAGKSDFILVKGRVWTIQPGSELYQVPLWEQRAKFENTLHLKSSDNTEFTAGPVYSFRVIESKGVDVVFNNKHLGSGSDFIQQLQDNVLEPKIYDLMKEHAKTYTTDSLMQDGGSLKYENEIQKIITDKLAEYGVELITFSPNLDFSAKVKAKIDNRNEVNTNISVIEQQILEQKKRNELEELKTQQQLIASRGLTPQVLQQQFIDKWDGKSPLYGNVPVTLLKTVN